ncbi:transposase zinc-binding domain-containing protein [Peptococcaceae bacterium]|nr:transposase zinc-binding domain-containing protein [Peptococcaceae bacterium]
MTTIQNIFQQFYAQYKQSSAPNKQQAKAAKAIVDCRTAALGGHVDMCKECGYTGIWYNSWLALCRKLTCSPAYKSKFEELKTIEILCCLLGRDVTICPACNQGKLQLVYSLAPVAPT